MLHCPKNTSVRKSLFLSSFGICLHTLGSVCLIASAIGLAKNTNQHLKATIIQELAKQDIAQ